MVKNTRPRRDVVAVIIAGRNDIDREISGIEIVDGMDIEWLKMQAVARRGGANSMI